MPIASMADDKRPDIDNKRIVKDRLDDQDEERADSRLEEAVNLMACFYSLKLVPIPGIFHDDYLFDKYYLSIE